MARIRTIKPEFWHDEKVGHLSIPARLLFIGLWNLADDSGIVRGNPIYLRSQLFPYDDIKKDAIEKWVSEIEKQRMVRTFEAHLEKFIEIINFKKHQVINRPSKARVLATLTEGSLSDHGVITEHSVMEREGEVGNGNGAWNWSMERETYCGEPLSSPEPSPPSPTVISIPVLAKNGNGEREHHVTEADVAQLEATFPAVDILHELRLIRQWNMDNPTRRKTPRGVRQHISGWMAREQDRGLQRGPGSKTPQTKTYEHNAAAISQAIAELQEGVNP